MNRLLQGDVGSGKTIVALFAILIAIEITFKLVLLHLQKFWLNNILILFRELLSDSNINLNLLTGSTKAKERKIINLGLKMELFRYLLERMLYLRKMLDLKI